MLDYLSPLRLRLFKSIFLLTAFVLMLSHLAGYAQNQDAEILKALNSVISPVETLNPDSSFSDLSSLDDVVSTKNIIGLGEVTHGTAEVFAYKDRLIRYLVTKHNFKAIGFESDFVAVEHLDDYINLVVDTIKFTGGFPLIKETKAMLSWLRDYNSDQSDTNRVHLYGLEVRGFYSIAANVLAAAPNLPAASKEMLQKFAATNYNALSNRDIVEMKTALSSIRTEKELQGVSPDVFEHYIKLFEQALDHFRRKWSGRRDQSMASNASWILKHTENKKLILWAHNGHVAKSSLFGHKTMGQHLAESYNYYVMGTDFSEGEVSVFVKDQGKFRLKPVAYQKPDSRKMYEYYFQQLKSENFLLDINRSLSIPVLKSLFEKPMYMRMIGGTVTKPFVKLAMAKHFDLIVFIKRSTAG